MKNDNRDNITTNSAIDIDNIDKASSSKDLLDEDNLQEGPSKNKKSVDDAIESFEDLFSQDPDQMEKDSKDYQVCPTKDGYTCCGPSLYN